MTNTAQNTKELVITNIICTMQYILPTIQLQMLENAIRTSLHGLKIEEETTSLSTNTDNLEYIIKCFAANKKVEGCTKETIKQYIRTAKKFFFFINKNYKDITKDDVKKYLAVRTTQVKQNTVVNEKRNLSSFFTWLNDEGYITGNPVKSIKGIREEDVEVKAFSIDEETSIRNVQKSLRDSAIIAFLLSTGLRVGEVSSLNITNVDLQNGTVTFRGEKSRKKKFRTVYLDETARIYLQEYLKSRTDTNPALFVTTRTYDGQPKRLKNAAFEKITKKTCFNAGVEGKGTVHVFRRTFATRLSDNGCPVEVIQELLGHADPATTTKHYIAKNPNRMRKTWEKYWNCNEEKLVS